MTLGLSRHLEGGGGALFVTLTGAHHRGQSLGPLLGLVSSSLGRVMKGRRWSALRDVTGYIGAVRSVEVTYGENGWHPHCHAVLLFARGLTEDEVGRVRSVIFDQWQSVLGQRGFGELHPVHGVDVRPVGDAETLGQYVTKVEGGWGVGAELTAGAVKSGGLQPVHLLREFASTGDLAMLGLWRHYERHTFGKRFLVWSRGLRALLLPDLVDQADEEVAAAEGEDVRLIVVQVGAEEWSAWVRSGEVGEFLQWVEQGAALMLAMCGVFGKVGRDA